MKAEDLLQAMNDIDTKYVAEAQPWTAPVKKLHHPVWAAAAAVMLCLGLGAGAAVLLHSPAVQPGAEGGVTTELASEDFWVSMVSDPDYFVELHAADLDFAQLSPETIPEFGSTYGPAYAAAHTPVAGNYFEVVLGQEPLKRIWQGVSLPWDGIVTGNVTLEATAAFSEEGDLIQVYVEGLQDDPATPEEERYRLFEIQLVSQAYAEANAADWSQQVAGSLAEANNQVDGTPVVAGWFQETALNGDAELDETVAKALFSVDGAIVTIAAASSEMAFPTQEEAQAFVEQAAGYSLFTGIDLSLLRSALYANPYGETGLDFAQWDETEYETLFREWADSYAAEVIEPQVMEPDSSYRTQDLSPEQIKALWGGEFPWEDEHAAFQDPRGYTYHTEEGEPVYAVIEIGGGDVGFTVTILPQYPQGEWGEALTAVLAQANEEVNGVPVLTSGTQLSTAAYTKYEALFQPQSSDSVIHAEAHAGDTQSDFSPEDAQAFVEQVVEGTLTGGIDLTMLQP